MKKDSERGIGFRVQYGNGSGNDTKTKSLVKNRRGDAIFHLEQDDYNIEELKTNSNFLNLAESYKRCLLSCYECVKPLISENLTIGYNPEDATTYYQCGAYKLIKDKESIAKGLIEMIYGMRNSLFHGELIPCKDACETYGAAYRILRKLIDAI